MCRCRYCLDTVIEPSYSQCRRRSRIPASPRPHRWSGWSHCSCTPCSPAPGCRHTVCSSSIGVKRWRWCGPHLAYLQSSCTLSWPLHSHWPTSHSSSGWHGHSGHGYCLLLLVLLELKMKVIPRFAKISESAYSSFYIDDSIQTLCTIYFKRILTPQQVDMKLGCWHKGHNGGAVWLGS